MVPLRPTFEVWPSFCLRTLQEESAPLHDGQHSAAVLGEDPDVAKRIAIDENDVRFAARLEPAEGRLLQDIGVHQVAERRMSMAGCTSRRSRNSRV